MLNPTQFQAKEEKIKAANDSLSEVYPLNEMHPLSETSCPLSGWENLEEEKSKICALNQPAQRGCCFFLRLARPLLLSENSLTLA